MTIDVYPQTLNVMAAKIARYTICFQKVMNLKHNYYYIYFMFTQCEEPKTYRYMHLCLQNAKRLKIIQIYATVNVLAPASYIEARHATKLKAAKI